MPETTTTDTVEPATHAAGGTKPAELVVRYGYADGIVIEGKTYPHRSEVKKAQPRWRWCGSLRQWVVPRMRERVLSSDQVEEYAEGLRAAGVPNVRVDYQEPRPGDVLDLDQVGAVVETLEERALDPAERLDGATAWLDRMKQITAGHFIRCLPTSYRNAMAIMGQHRARYGLERAQPRPRNLDPTVARRILEEVLGIAFDAEDDDGASPDHRDGGTAPEALGELAKEHAIGTTATTASTVSEAISAVMREIEQATSSLIGRLEHEATTGPEDEKVTDSIEDERLADEPADTREGTTDEHAAGTPSAGREPRGKAAPGSLGTVEGTHVHTPTGHQPPLCDVTASDPAVLVRTRATGRAMVPLRRSALWTDMGPWIRGPPRRPGQRCHEVTGLD